MNEKNKPMKKNEERKKKKGVKRSLMKTLNKEKKEIKNYEEKY